MFYETWIPSIPICRCGISGRSLAHRSEGGLLFLFEQLFCQFKRACATYDFVSSVGLPVGPQINIDVPNEEANAKQVFEIDHLHERIPLTRFSFTSDNIESDDFLISALAQHKFSSRTQAVSAGLIRFGFINFLFT